MSNEWFRFQRFTIRQTNCAMKVGTDGVLLGAWAKGGKRILDIGTGTGLIALMMAQRYAEADIEAIDIEHDACEQAKENVAASPYAGRVAVREVALQQFDTAKHFDSIISNPPYFIDGLRNPDAKRSLARHAHSLPYEVLCRAAYQLLEYEGEMSVVLPVETVDSFVSIACISGFYIKRKYLVKTTSRKPPRRCLLAFVKQRPQELDEQLVTLLDEEGRMTEWYAHLTGQFYLHQK